jgi:thiamine-phosphate pyrophosphorylase
VSAFDASRGIVCLLTHGERIAARCGAAGRAVEDLLVAQVREAAEAGVDLVQVREPDLEARDLCRLVERCLRAAAGAPTRIVLNDRLDAALATGAHGVHLRADSYAAGRVRATAPVGFLVGRSVHEPGEAAAVAGTGDVDYLIFGTVFASASKAPGHRTTGVEGLATAAVGARPVPVLAIGGVSIESARGLRAAGASGLAAIGLFLPGGVGATASIAETVRRLRTAFDTPVDLS